MDKKRYLVMSGGNTKGGYQAGAIKYFEEKGLTFDSIYGVSVGAVNALGWAYGDAEKLIGMWKSLKATSDILKRESWWRFLFDLFPAYNMRPLQKKMEDYVDDEYSALKAKAPRCRAVVSYVDLKDGSLKHADNTQMSVEEFIKWVICSASEPPLVKAFEDRYLDGGLRDQTPLKKAIDDGADQIWVVLTSPFTQKMEEWKSEWPHTWNQALRTLDIVLNEAFYNDIQRCLDYNKIPGKKEIDLRWIAPSVYFPSAFKVDPARIVQAIDLGYQDAPKLLTGAKQ